MRVSVIVPTKDRPAELGGLLKALGAQTRPPDEVVVVDAGAPPAPGLPEAAAAVGLTLRHLRESPNVCRQRNVGAREARGEVLVFLDDDVLPEPGFVATLLAAFDARPECAGGTGTLPPDTDRRSLGALACRVFMLQHEYGDGGFYPSGMPRHPYGRPDSGCTRVMGGGLMAVRKSAWEETGVRFDEAMEHSQEDTDFSYRLSLVRPLFYEPGARVVHSPSPLGRPDERERARRYVASYRYLYRKNFLPAAPWSLPFHWWTLAGLFLMALVGAPGRLGGFLDGLRTALPPSPGPGGRRNPVS